MKEVQVNSWCDGEHVMKAPATHEQEVSLSRNKRHTVDLCDECFNKLVAPLEAIVHEHGVPIEASIKAPKARQRRMTSESGSGMRVKDGPVKCPVCPHGSTTINGLKQHMNVHHPDRKLSEFEEYAS